MTRHSWRGKSPIPAPSRARLRRLPRGRLFSRANGPRCRRRRCRHPGDLWPHTDRSQFDHKPVRRIQPRYFEIDGLRIAIQVEYNPRYPRRRLGNSNSLDEMVVDLPRRHTPVVDPGPRAQNIDEKPVRIRRAICSIFSGTAGFDDDPCGIGMRPRPQPRYLNYAGIRRGNHGEE